MLQSAGIDPRDCYFTNVFMEQRPPNNDLEAWMITKKHLPQEYSLPKIRGAKYLDPQYIPSLDRLYSEISILSPNLVIALGATALWALTGLNSIGTYRGTMFQWKGIKILPTFHPASILYMYKNYATVMADLMKAKREAEYPELISKDRRVFVASSLADVLDIKSRCLKSDLIAFDIETKRRQITCIGFSPSPDRAYVIPFVKEDWTSYWPRDVEIAVWKCIEEILTSDVPKVGQNGVYDMQYLWKIMGIRTINYQDDTMLLHHALQPELPKGLGWLASVYTDAPSWKQLRKVDTLKKDE